MSTDDTRSVKPVPRRLRFEILRRDNYTCRYCGASAPEVPLTIDHVIPRALGGGDEPTNLVTACNKCNAGKGSTSPDENIVADVDAAAFLFAKAMDRAAAIRATEVDRLREGVEAFEKAWGRYSTTRDDAPIPKDSNWRTSVETFLERGLPAESMVRLVRVAMDSQAPIDEKFRFFCGCCWREITTLQEMARQMIEDGLV